MLEEQLCRKVYRLSRLSRHSSWANDLKAHLNDVEMAEQKEINIKELESKLTQQEDDRWKLEVSKKPKLRNYKDLQVERKILCYITSKLSKKERSLIYQLRTGTLPIEQELGRRKGLPVSERKCQVCETGEVEDEMHILFYCISYK